VEALFIHDKTVAQAASRKMFDVSEAPVVFTVYSTACADSKSTARIVSVLFILFSCVARSDFKGPDYPIVVEGT